jgi:hypothetical protein
MAKKMTSEVPAQAKIEEPPPSIDIEFNKKLKAPKEYDEVRKGDPVRIVVTGKVLKKSESESTNLKETWENYQRMKVEISAVDIEPLNTKAKSLKDAMEEVIQKRRT